MPVIPTNPQYKWPKPTPVLAAMLALYRESTNFATFKKSLASISVEYMSDLTDENKDFISDSLQASFFGFMLEVGNVLVNDYQIEPFINFNFASAVCTPKFVPIVLTVMLQDVCQLDIDAVSVLLVIDDSGVLTASCA